MEQPFLFFSVGSILFLIDRSIATLISLDYIATEPFNVVHLALETISVILLTVGFLLMYRNWSGVQTRIPEVSNEPLSV